MDERVLAALLAAPLPGDEGADDDAPGGDHERRQREAEGLDRRAARVDPAPVARLEDAEDEDREPQGREDPADQSRRGAGPSRRASRTVRIPSRIPIATTTSPAKITRQLSSVVAQPPRIGPTAMPTPETPPRTP